MKNPLQAYLDRHGLRPTPWANENELSAMVVSRYLNGVTGLSPRNARRISIATAGEVGELELLYWEHSNQEPAA